MQLWPLESETSHKTSGENSVAVEDHKAGVLCYKATSDEQSGNELADQRLLSDVTVPDSS